MSKEEHRLHFKVTQKLENTTEKVHSTTFMLEPVGETSSSKISLKIVETEDKRMKEDIGVELEEIGDIIEIRFGKKNIQGKLDTEEDEQDNLKDE